MDSNTGMDDFYIATFQDTPLTLACSQVNYDAAVQAISENVDVNQGNNNGETPLIQASRNAYKDEPVAMKIINLLLDKGADVNAQTHTDGDTALLRATYYGSFQVAKLLLNRGADVNLRFQNGETVLSRLESAPSLLRKRKRFIKLFEEVGGIR